MAHDRQALSFLFQADRIYSLSYGEQHFLRVVALGLPGVVSNISRRNLAEQPPTRPNVLHHRFANISTLF